MVVGLGLDGEGVESRGGAREGSKLKGRDATGYGRFGSSVALSADGSTALVGAPYDSSRPAQRGCFAVLDVFWRRRNYGETFIAAEAVPVLSRS